jgi:glycosyltransferase involved in cell wall biosynthesis
VIPAHNEERYLPRLLDSVEAARAAYRGDPADIEIIVSDNASTDRTREIAAQRGCVLAGTEVRNIGAVRNAAARLARGGLIAFVDADARLHPETFNAVVSALESPRVVAGSTGVSVERWSLGIAITYALMVPLVWVTGMDTGVVFCRRADFEAVGGYDERLRYAEDVMLLLALRRLGKTRGQHLVRVRWAKAVASTRKFDQHGEWHYLHLLWRGGLGLLGIGKADDLADRYWYGDQRAGSASAS